MDGSKLGEQYLEKIVGIWGKNQPEPGEKHKVSLAQEQPLVAPQEAHLRQEPLRTIVNC